MKFTAEEILMARKLKNLGLVWTPSVGNYVWDEADIIKCQSPFQDMVFYILDLKHFLRRVETIEKLQASLCWLPTWFDARQILRDAGVSGSEIADRLRQERAIENGRERMVLYRMIEESLVAANLIANV